MDCQLNLVELIEEIKKKAKLRTGGGHPEAAAFTADKDQFQKAVQRMKEIFKEYAKSEKEKKEDDKK